MNKNPNKETPSPYVSPKELSHRWLISRSSVDRIARRAGLTRLCIGEGKNGTVRFDRKEVLDYEAKQRIKAHP
jgi:hypothetical protein